MQRRPALVGSTESSAIAAASLPLVLPFAAGAAVKPAGAQTGGAARTEWQWADPQPSDAASESPAGRCTAAAVAAVAVVVEQTAVVAVAAAAAAVGQSRSEQPASPPVAAEAAVSGQPEPAVAAAAPAVVAAAVVPAAAAVVSCCWRVTSGAVDGRVARSVAGNYSHPQRRLPLQRVIFSNSLSGISNQFCIRSGDSLLGWPLPNLPYLQNQILSTSVYYDRT